LSNSNENFGYNFKDIVLFILLIGFSALVFFAVDILFDRYPLIELLFRYNKYFFVLFAYVFVFIIIVTNLLHIKSLDVFESETKSSITVSIFNVIVWMFFWMVWSIFCALLSLSFKPQSIEVKLTILTLLIVPSLSSFFISYNLRNEILKEEGIKNHIDIQKYLKSEPYYYRLERKYYSGYYALICIPVYLLTLAIGKFFIF
jgi:hypothetical protein